MRGLRRVGGGRGVVNALRDFLRGGKVELGMGWLCCVLTCEEGEGEMGKFVCSLLPREATIYAALSAENGSR